MAGPRYVKRFLAMLLAVSGCFVSATAQIDWTPYENNPVIDPNFDIGSTAIYRPTVVVWKGAYHMWYGKLWQRQRWMAYATSDDGINWEPAWHAVLGPSSIAGTFDELEATHGWVIAEGDTLKMWYSGGGNSASGIGLAWSVDGLSWTNVAGSAPGGSVLDPGTDGAGATVITHPTVVKKDDTYHMWYIRAYIRATDTEARIGYARSNDGRAWQVVSGSGENGAVLDRGTGNEFDSIAIQWPAAIHNGDHFEMWYQGLGPDAKVVLVPRVGCARSDDGITWQKISGAQANAGACFNSFAQPAVLLESGQYKMWYGLSAMGKNGDVVMYATSAQIETATEPVGPPSVLEMLEVYPNPMRTTANIRVALRKPGALLLEVHDILGRTVSRTYLGARNAGEQKAVWNGLDAAGTLVPAGVYILSVSDVSSGARSAGSLVSVVR